MMMMTPLWCNIVFLLTTLLFPLLVFPTTTPYNLDTNPYLLAYNIISNHTTTTHSHGNATANSTTSTTTAAHHFHSLSNWTEVINVTNSHIVQNAINSTWPKSWQYPLLIGTIADEHYIRSARLFYESMLLQGFEAQDLFVLCVSIACSEALTKYEIPHYVTVNEHCHGKIKCLISDGKFAGIAYLLSLKINFLFVDLDVFFKTLNLSTLHLHPQLDIMVQHNHNIWTYHDLYNFGLFLVRPSMNMIHLFQHMLEIYRKDTSVWDQRLFNDPFYGLMKPNQHEFFNQSEFYLFGFPEFRSYPSERVHGIHMVCVDGEMNKLLLASEYFGPFAYPSIYDVRNHHLLGGKEQSLLQGNRSTTARNVKIFRAKYTITIPYDPKYKKHELAGLINLAIKFWRSFPTKLQEDTFIRVTGWDYYHKVLALYNADLLIEENILLVEADYWQHVQIYMNQHHPTLPMITIQNISVDINHSDIIDTWNSNSNNQKFHNDQSHIHQDFIFTVQNLSVLSDPLIWKDGEQYLCWHYASTKPPGCSAACNGPKHFRDRNFPK